jgi:hypothetical protein
MNSLLAAAVVDLWLLVLLCSAVRGQKRTSVTLASPAPSYTA